MLPDALEPTASSTPTTVMVYPLSEKVSPTACVVPYISVAASEPITATKLRLSISGCWRKRPSATVQLRMLS